MKKRTGILLRAVISAAVATQLLSMVCFRHSFTIGGEMLIPALVLLIRQVVIKIVNIFK